MHRRHLYLWTITLATFEFLCSGAGADIRTTRVGAPVWQPVDLHLVETVYDPPTYEQLLAVYASLLPEPNHRPHPQLGTGPGDPHTGFDREFGTNLTALGYADQSEFTVEQFTGTRGATFVYMVVPGEGAPSGRSPDGTTPIIPNSVFPIQNDLQILRNGGVDVNFPGATIVPPLDTNLNPPFNDIDGHSHFPMFLSFSFLDLPDQSVTPVGSYEILLNLRDTTGAGWDVSATFNVVPEPSSCSAGGVALLSMLVFRSNSSRRFKISDLKSDSV
jgi:hypothetical protein